MPAPVDALPGVAAALAGLVWLPLAFGLAAYATGPRLARTLALPGAVVVLGLAAWIATVVYAGGPQRYAFGGWPGPLAVAIRVDGLAASMLLLSAVIATLVAVYARGWFAGRESETGFWPLWWFLWAAQSALYLAADVFNAYVTLELLGLSAVGLVALGGGATALAAALRYLLAALFGSLAYLLGVALLYGNHGVLSFEALAPVIAGGPVAGLVLALFTLGLALKTALVPLHWWLPPAHGGAEAPVSALLSALVVKASFYLLFRLWFELFDGVATVAAAQLLGALGAVAILYGGIEAFLQRRLKMLVAYSTVAQLGYLFLAFALATGVATPAATAARQGVLYYVLTHGFAKAGMFLAAGTIVRSLGRDDVEHLEGTAAHMPWSLFAFALAGVTLMGLPPSGGFVAKWLLLSSAIASGQWWWVVALLAGGLLTAAYVFRVLRYAFVPPLPRDGHATVPRSMELAAFALAATGLLLGLVAPVPLELLATSAPVAPRAAP